MKTAAQMISIVGPLFVLASVVTSPRAEAVEISSLVAGATLALPGSEWEAFGPRGGMPASFAWAGEDESGSGSAFTAIVPLPGTAFLTDIDDVDLQLVTGLAAPEPPAIVLAGIALGSLACGRSLFRKRGRRAADTATT